MLKRQIVIRTDGNSLIGMGHFYRSLALVSILKQDFICTLAVTGNDPYQEQLIRSSSAEYQHVTDEGSFAASLPEHTIVVTDGYHFGTTLHPYLKKQNCFIVHIDDVLSEYQLSDVLINPASGVSIEDYPDFQGMLLAGTGFALLRESFIHAAAQPVSEKNKDQLILSMGGADTAKLTVLLLKKLHALLPELPITVLTGQAFTDHEALREYVTTNDAITHHHNLDERSVCRLFQDHRFAFVPSSVMGFEALACGCYTITGYFATNQQRFNAYLDQNRIAFNLGNLEHEPDLEALRTFMADPDSYIDMKNRNGFRVELSGSSENIRKHFLALA